MLPLLPLLVLLVLQGVAVGQGERAAWGLSGGRRKKAMGAELVPRRGVVILFDGSQGSSFFIEILAQLEEVCIVGYEPLTTGKRGRAGGRAGSMLTRLHDLLYTRDFSVYGTQVLEVDSREHLDKCTGREPVFGLKARLDKRVVSQVLKDPAFSSTQFIILRRNFVKQAAATLRRKSCGLGQFNLRIKIEKKEAPQDIQSFIDKKCMVKPKEFRELVSYYAKRAADLTSVKRNDGGVFLEVNYEEMTENITQLVSQRVAPFLGTSSKLKKSAKPVTLVKASPDLLCNSLENYDEVCGVIKAMHSPALKHAFNADACAGSADVGIEEEVNLLAQKGSVHLPHACCVHC